MKRALVFAICSFLCLISYGQSKIDFVDFFRSFNWEWSNDDYKDKYGDNVSVSVDSLVISNVTLGDYCGDLIVLRGSNEKALKTFLFNIPEDFVYKSLNLLSERLGKPDSTADNEYGLNVMWTLNDKTLILAKLSTLSAITCYSTSTLEYFRKALAEALTPSHIKFKGIPVDGTPENFVKELLSQGFYNPINLGGTWVVEGPFAGYNKVRVLISSTNDLVFNATVTIDFNDNWPNVKSAYERLKASLKNKYDVEPDVTEYFPSYPSEGSGLEYRAFLQDKAKYQSVFVVEGGIIQLYIARLEEADGFEIFISYSDGENLSKRFSSIEDDL